MTTTKRGGFKLLGLGALACVGCGAGPVLAFLGGLSIAGVASTAVIGGAGVVIAVLALAAYAAVRRRRSTSCAVTNREPVAVASPTRREAP